MILNFDNAGNLIPYEGITADLVNFEAVFITSFPQSITRRRLFDYYQQALASLPAEVAKTGMQWIDGSFVSNKLNPNDLDIVMFVDYLIFEQYKLHYFDTKSLKLEKGIDLYFVRSYPENHPYHFRTQFDEHEWQALFSYNRQSQPKGFIKLS